MLVFFFFDNQNENEMETEHLRELMLKWKNKFQKDAKKRTIEFYRTGFSTFPLWIREVLSQTVAIGAI
ncbi:hypothetical protein [Peribacillus sp. NPDC096448]|uniref:hypothetical protein n=1 Tax=Peribacillus sp. NPDC096448 TaxID=3364395 RepID=UPI00382D1B0F